MVGCVAFNFEVIRYKTLLDLLNLSPEFSKSTATPNLAPIQDVRLICSITIQVCLTYDIITDVYLKYPLPKFQHKKESA